MSTFRVKSGKVEAVQWFKDGDSPDVYMLGGDPVFEMAESVVPLDVNPGDWIVTLPSGKVRLYTTEEFEAEFLTDRLDEGRAE